MTDNKPTLHHLNNSQSQRILWLLEELGIEYDLVLHTRGANFRSPPSLLEIGYAGTAPALLTGSADGTRYIPETMAIANYLIRTFDNEDKFGLRNGDLIRDDMLVSMAMTSMGAVGFCRIMLDFGMLRNGEGPGGDSMDGPAIRKNLGQVEMMLRDGPPGGYFMGKEPGRADIMLEFGLTSCKQRNYVDMEEEFPLLDAWLERVYNRPAFKRSMEKGNGYNMAAFPGVREKKKI